MKFKTTKHFMKYLLEGLEETYEEEAVEEGGYPEYNPDDPYARDFVPPKASGHPSSQATKTPEHIKAREQMGRDLVDYLSDRDPGQLKGMSHP